MSGPEHDPASGAGLSLFSDAERRHLRRRRRRGARFRWLTAIPLAIALTLVVVLVVQVLVDSVSWQVVEPANSGSSFAWAEGFRFGGTSDRVIRLDLAAGGMSAADIDALFADAETLRRFRLRNRVELMASVDGKPWRWVLTNGRDRRVTDVGLLAGIARRGELLEGLQAGQRLYLNPWLDFSFFKKNASRTPTMAGLASALVGSLWVTALVILISVPIGVGAALYLEEYAPDTWVTRLLEVNLRNLAGVPSIVYGLLGLTLFVRLLGLGTVVLAAALTLSLLVMPVVVIAAREAIRAVPDSLRLGAFGLGATQGQVVRSVVLPNAVAGIVTGVILAIARAVGETAPLLVIGAAAFVPRLPDGPMSNYTVLPIQIYAWVSANDVEFQHVASAGILVLLMLLTLLYLTAFWLRRRFARRW